MEQGIIGKGEEAENHRKKNRREREREEESSKCGIFMREGGQIKRKMLSVRKERDQKREQINYLACTIIKKIMFVAADDIV